MFTVTILPTPTTYDAFVILPFAVTCFRTYALCCHSTTLAYVMAVILTHCAAIRHPEWRDILILMATIPPRNL